MWVIELLLLHVMLRGRVMLGVCHVCDSCVKKNPVFVTSDTLVVEALQEMVQGLYQS